MGPSHYRAGDDAGFACQEFTDWMMQVEGAIAAAVQQAQILASPKTSAVVRVHRLRRMLARTLPLLRIQLQHLNANRKTRLGNCHSTRAICRCSTTTCAIARILAHPQAK